MPNTNKQLLSPPPTEQDELMWGKGRTACYRNNLLC